MYIETVPNRNSPPAILLRESWREGKTVRKKTLLNLSQWPEPVVQGLRRLLAGEELAGVQDVFAIERSWPHGHVEAVLLTMRRLGLESLIASQPSRARDLVVAMVAARVIAPYSKLGTTRLWKNTTLAAELHVGDADVDELYDALDWLLARQEKIEKKLAKRHLAQGAIVMYDLSSSYYEGHTCPLAAFGHGREKRGLPIIAYGVMTDSEGRPLADERRRRREELLEATEKSLKQISAEIARRTKKILSDAEIGVKVGKIIGLRKMAKHFDWRIAQGRLEWSRKEESIEREKQLDGFYVIRTSEPQERLSPEDAVRNYKKLAQVERAFRALKGIDLRVRPIHHRTEDHVRAHIFLCLLAYYVEWHMRAALAPLLFDDEELDQLRPQRDPVDPAQSSPSAKRKKNTLQTDDGLEVQSFHSLLSALGTRCRNLCRTNTSKASHSFELITEATALQARAMKLLRMYPVQ